MDDGVVYCEPPMRASRQARSAQTRRNRQSGQRISTCRCRQISNASHFSPPLVGYSARRKVRVPAKLTWARGREI